MKYSIVAISIHAPSRERPPVVPFMDNIYIISIHAPSRERPACRSARIGSFDFNPRSLTGATQHTRVIAKFSAFQSTLPHGSDLCQALESCQQIPISIHAPSRERHISYVHGSRGHEFQSTLPHGSDRMLRDLRFLSRDFNPRSLTGATQKQADTAQRVGISIHAPSRERHSCSMTISRVRHFNPRSLTGATIRQLIIAISIRNFNPRSLTGATTGLYGTSGFVMNFNPRSLTGATCQDGSPDIVRTISIHAPSRERPYGFNVVGAVTFISIHAPSRERLIYTESEVSNMLFQSTLPHGSDFCALVGFLLMSDFNPRSLTGAT